MMIKTGKELLLEVLNEPLSGRRSSKIIDAEFRKVYEICKPMLGDYLGKKISTGEERKAFIDLVNELEKLKE